MISRWHWLLLQFARRLWVRAALFSAAAAATALAAIVLAPSIPIELSAKIGADAIDNILNILAASMLAVTTFSLTTMVSAYGAATSNATPRATKLLMDDTTAQNVLGTFIGSFLYALVGIIALSTGAYGSQGRVVMFAVTVGLIVLIVGTLIRWIDHLSRMGRVGETTARVEQATADALRERIERPALGGRMLDRGAPPPPGAAPIHTAAIGYVQHIDMQALSEAAGDGDIHVAVVPGAFVDPSRPLAHAAGIGERGRLEAIRRAFTIGSERSFDQDPRFGLCVLAEIASRALSPAMNDPGTAIDVIGRAVRILMLWRPKPAEGEPDCPRVWVPALAADDLLDDIFAPLARDGAALFEVMIRLEKALLSLFQAGDPTLRAAARRHAAQALARAEAGLALDSEKAMIRAIAARFEGTAPRA